jgi:serine/threonine-protein kinase
VTLFAGRYELGPVIGRGGMAEVRAATDTRLHRPVAIKTMWPEAATQPLVRSRFESEARLAARLSHPNVVSIFDSGEDEGVPFIVMERVSGETLHDRLAADDARSMVLEVLAALETAHAAGILHRDIKPANILEAGGHWKVADFGIAKALETDSGDHTATGLVLGTPAYLAPERLFGSPASVPADIYALGVVAYEALTGSKPFHSNSGGSWPGSMALRPLVPLSSARPGIDPVLAGVIERSLDKDPLRRFQSASEMALALRGSPEPWPTVAAPPPLLVAAGGAPAVTRVMDDYGAGWGPAPTSVLGVDGVMGASAAAGVRRSAGWGPRERRLTGLAALALAALVAMAFALTSLGGHSGGGPISKRSPATTLATTTTTTSSTSTTTTSTTVPAPAHAKPTKGPGHGPGPGPGGGGRGDG